MKTKVLYVLLLAVFVVTPPVASAQQPEETVVIKKSDLTKEQLAKVQKEEITSQLGAYKEYAEMGRGVGLAVGESLKAVKDVALDFSKTDVGKYTMFLIAWKVMAKDVIDVVTKMGDQFFGYLIGPPVLLIGGLVLIWSYRRQCLPRRMLIEKTKEGKKWAIIAPNGEKVDIGDTRPHMVSGRSVWAVGHAVAALVLIAVCSMMTFSC